jgi:3-deoxy-D-manno-octulosonic-acid transferase
MRSERRPRIWIHAASVGEVSVVRPILKAFARRVPAAGIVLTVITPGGYEVARGLVGTEVEGVAYLPFDLAPLAGAAVRWVRPDLFVGIETEIWPNLLHALRRYGSRAALVNARLSDRSYPRYMRIRRLMRWALAGYDRIVAQSAEDARRFATLGARADRLSVGGNVKFDEADKPLDGDAVARLRADLGIAPRAPVLVIGSTRSPAEEALVREAVCGMHATLRGLVTIHAPRHIERAEGVCADWRAYGFRVVRRTEPTLASEDAQIIVLDTFGELGRVYAVGDAAFVGNSLVRPGGGQNLLQPLAQGKAVLFGPYVSNFRDAAALASAEGVGFVVTCAADLARKACELIADPARRAEIGARALDLVERNRGAADRYADVLADLLGSRCVGTA